MKVKSLFSASNTETSSQSAEKASASTSSRRVSYVYNSTFRSKKEEIKEKR